MAKTAHSKDDYVRGSQEISEQEATFALFGGLTKWGSLHTAAILLFLVLWFMPNGSFFLAVGGLIVLEVAGWFALKAKKAPAHA